MANCHEMKKGEIYVCKECGLELKVMEECKEAGTPAESCTCHSGSEHGEFTCCSKALIKKTS